MLTSFMSGLVKSDIYVTLMCNFEVHYQHELFYILKLIWHALPQHECVQMLNNCKNFKYLEMTVR